MILSVQIIWGHQLFNLLQTFLCLLVMFLIQFANVFVILVLLTFDLLSKLILLTIISLQIALNLIVKLFDLRVQFFIVFFEQFNLIDLVATLLII